MYGKARAPAVLDTPPAFAAQAGFTQSPGALTGDALEAGGLWTPVTGSDADDFAVVGGGVVERTSTNDSGSWALGGRGLYASGPTLGACLIQFDFATNTAADDVHLYEQGFFARLNPATGDALLVYRQLGIRGEEFIYVQKFIGGSYIPVIPGGGTASTVDATPGVFYTLSLLLDTLGNWSLWFTTADQELAATPNAQGQESDLAGTLASGKIGPLDANSQAAAVTRSYKNFRAWVPNINAAIHAGRSATFFHDRAERQSINGTANGRVPVFEGKHLTVKPGTRAGRTSRVVVKMRRLDIDSGLPSTGLADTALAELVVTPRVVLFSLGGIVGFPVYTLSNINTDHGFNANATTFQELANNLGTLIGEYPLPVGTWTNSNVTTDRTLNANTATGDEMADVLGTLITDLQIAPPHPPYSITNVTTRRILNATTITPEQFADVLGTFINDLTAIGDL